MIRETQPATKQYDAKSEKPIIGETKRVYYYIPGTKSVDENGNEIITPDVEVKYADGGIKKGATSIGTRVEAIEFDSGRIVRQQEIIRTLGTVAATVHVNGNVAIKKSLTDKADTFTAGTLKDEMIEAGKGNDTLIASGGHDLIDGDGILTRGSVLNNGNRRRWLRRAMAHAYHKF